MTQKEALKNAILELYNYKNITFKDIKNVLKAVNAEAVSEAEEQIKIIEKENKRLEKERKKNADKIKSEKELYYSIKWIYETGIITDNGTKINPFVTSKFEDAITVHYRMHNNYFIRYTTNAPIELGYVNNTRTEKYNVEQNTWELVE